MPEDSTSLSKKEITRAATNDPELSEKVVTLKGREFKIVDLPYDEHLKFLTGLEPLIEGISGALTGDGISAESSFSLSTIVKYCGEAIPEMACIVCKQTDSTLTVDDVKNLGSPIKLASLVFTQIEQNNMIDEIADFFVQSLQLLSRAKKATEEAK